MRLQDVILRDTRTNQPAATDVATGTLYCVTDEGDTVERSNGTIWQSFGVIGTVEIDGGNATGATAVDWSDGPHQLFTLTGNVTFTFSGGVAGCSYRLILVQDGTGGRTVTWPASVVWEGGTAPTLVTTANNVILCSFVYTNAGANGYLGFATTQSLTL